MWEYKRVEYKFNIINDLEVQLNKEGEDGWEMSYYQETKPEKFGDPFKSIVLYKRLKETSKVL